MIPLFGLGMDADDAKPSVVAALNAGYRLIDTAQQYGNEKEVGEGIKEWIEGNGEKARPYVVTKLASDVDASNVRASLIKSLSLLQLDKVDLFLIHSPVGGCIVDKWRAMLAVRDSGLCSAVGVSNFGVAQLRGLKEAGLEIPEVNQIELHVWHQQKDTTKWCRDNGIQVMGYCPLARMKQMGTGDVKVLADELGVSEPALAIRYLLECGYVTIPKSTNPARIAKNATIVDMPRLTGENMERLGRADEGFKASNSSKNMDLPWDDVK